MYLPSTDHFFAIIKQGEKSKLSGNVNVYVSVTTKWIVNFFRVTFHRLYTKFQMF